MTTTQTDASPPGPLIQRIIASRLPEPAERRAIRIAARVSLREMGEELGVHESTAAKWERGEVRPRPGHALAYRGLLEALREVVTG